MRLLSAGYDFEQAVLPLAVVGLVVVEGGYGVDNHHDRYIPSIIAHAPFRNVIGVSEQAPLESEASLRRANSKGMPFMVGTSSGVTFECPSADLLLSRRSKTYARLLLPEKGNKNAFFRKGAFLRDTADDSNLPSGNHFFPRRKKGAGMCVALNSEMTSLGSI